MRCASFFVVLVLATRRSPLVPSSISQRHHRVNGSKQNQCQRKWDVQQQPPMQPMMQAFLSRKLASFVANVFKVRERSVRRSRQQCAQSSKRAARFCCITKTLSTFFRPLQKRPHVVQVKTAKRRALFLAQQNNLRSGSHSSARASADGGGSTQRNRGRGDGPHRREASRAQA